MVDRLCLLTGLSLLLKCAHHLILSLAEVLVVQLPLQVHHYHLVCYRRYRSSERRRPLHSTDLLQGIDEPIER